MKTVELDKDSSYKHFQVKRRLVLSSPSCEKLLLKSPEILAKRHDKNHISHIHHN